MNLQWEYMMRFDLLPQLRLQLLFPHDQMMLYLCLLHHHQFRLRHLQHRQLAKLCTEVRHHQHLQ